MPATTIVVVGRHLAGFYVDSKALYVLIIAVVYKLVKAHVIIVVAIITGFFVIEVRG
jgi:hypothetical protein